MTILTISSKNRVTSSADFIYNFLERPFEKCSSKGNKMKLLYCLIGNTVYTVTAANNAINWNDGSATLTTTVSAGVYTVASLCAALGTAMTASSSGNKGLTVSVSASTSTEFITISAGSNLTLNMASSSTTIAGLLGFASSTLSDTKTYGSRDSKKESKPPRHV